MNKKIILQITGMHSTKYGETEQFLADIELFQGEKLREELVNKYYP